MSARIEGQLGYDGPTGRMTLTRRSDENDDREFHCGEVFEICVEGFWHRVRIEHTDRWVLIGVSLNFRAVALRYLDCPIRIV